jgi:hypothetical protein
MNYKTTIETKKDIKGFISWVKKNENKYIDNRYKLMIINNIITSYELLGGDLFLDKKPMKIQMKMMWEWIIKNK